MSHFSQPEETIGQQRIRALTRSAVREAEAEGDKAAVRGKRSPARWPDKGMPYEGILPGAWRQTDRLDDTGHLPEDCPVRPLGYDGERRYFVDTAGQIFNTDGKAMGVERLQLLFAAHEGFLLWAWPSFAKSSEGKPGAVTNFKAEEARRDLYAACYERGPWSMTEQVRGRGAWLDDRGRLVLHCGELLYVDGRAEGTGELGEHFYVRRPKAIEPYHKPIEGEDNPAVDLIKALRTWNFVRGDVDAFLLLGFIGVAFMGAALDWRPSAFLVGDAGCGKSELQKLIKGVMGRFMISTTNATSAGLYQIVGHDALPIGIDELEGEDNAKQAADIIKMARDAASGSMRIRGGANHQGVEFQARSTFLFSAINPPGIPPASMTRLALLQMRLLTDTAAAVPTIPNMDTVGPKLLRRVSDHFGEFPRIYEAYRTVLRENGHDSRGQNTFGTFLAAAHLLLGDEGMEAVEFPFEKLDIWGKALAADAAPEVSGKSPNWAKCIDEIMMSQVDAWNKGERRTIGQIIEAVIEETDLMNLEKANVILAITGLKLLPKNVTGTGYTLCVPMTGKDINKLVADSTWSAERGSNGSWHWALGQAPENIVHKAIRAKSGRGDPDKLDNRQRIGGTQRRCMFISLQDLRDWQEGA